MSETVYTLKELAQKLKVSKETARQLFGKEPGVLAFNANGKRSTSNGRVSIRVPESVFQRVVNQMQRC